ncbi:MAG: hypothetical protein ABIJ21_07460 [Nanoarchaeota archaeon]
MELEIEKRLAAAGYRMLGDDKHVEELIRDILKSGNTRYLKTIPFLIYKYDPNLKFVRDTLDGNMGELYGRILNFTARIFGELHIQKEVYTFIRDFGTGCDFINKKFKVNLNYDEFKAEFELQLQNETKPKLLIDTQKFDEERNLQFALAQLFTKKEREIIKRLQADKPVTRTDYEYYSRKTRKKVRSIISLHDFALGISEKSPTVETREN